MTTVIHSNGSKWAGEAPDTIDDLLKVLAEEPLDRRFERYGDFVQFEPELAGGGRLVGMTYYFGNFFTCSHVFRIETDDPEVISKLTPAIMANKQRPDYLSQREPKD